MSWILSKSRDEVKDYVSEVKRSWKRKSWKDRLIHFPVDVFVEGYRRMPYTLGHLSAIGLGLSIILHFM